MRSMYVCITSGAIAASTAIAGAAITTTDPGLFVSGSIDDRFESRIRVDGGNSQTWKTAFWDDATLLSNSGINQNVFTDNVTYDFRLQYDALSGDTTLSVFDVNLGGSTGDLMLNDTIALTPGMGLAGFRFFIVSEDDGSTATAANFMASIDGATPESVPGLFSGPTERFVESDVFYFDQYATTFQLDGQINFDWVNGANLQGERFKLSVKLLEGAPIPSPGSLAIIGLLGAGLVRRRHR